MSQDENIPHIVITTFYTVIGTALSDTALT